MKPTLFLMEYLIAIMIFALCATACVGIFATSFMFTNESKELNNSLLIAESGAEAYKSTLGEIESTALILGGTTSGNTIFVYYDKSWQICEKSEALYFLSIICENPAEAPASIRSGNVTVQKIDGKEIIALTVAAREYSK